LKASIVPFAASSTVPLDIETLTTSVYRFSWSVLVTDLTPQICVEPNKYAYAILILISPEKRHGNKQTWYNAAEKLNFATTELPKAMAFIS
jgi:hypothetical protein